MGGTAIDELDGDVEEAGRGLTLAATLVACVAILLVLAPVAIALFQLELPLAWASAVAGGVGATLGGIKLVAMAWGAGARLLRPRWVTASSAFGD